MSTFRIVKYTSLAFDPLLNWDLGVTEKNPIYDEIPINITVADQKRFFIQKTAFINLHTVFPRYTVIEK